VMPGDSIHQSAVSSFVEAQAHVIQDLGSLLTSRCYEEDINVRLSRDDAVPQGTCRNWSAPMASPIRLLYLPEARGNGNSAHRGATSSKENTFLWSTPH
jgi:hypothetical protein